MSVPAHQLPAWVYDIVVELQEQEETHPKLYFTSGGFKGYRQYDWCSCHLLTKVPEEVQTIARGIAAYKRASVPTVHL